MHGKFVLRGAFDMNFASSRARVPCGPRSARELTETVASPAMSGEGLPGCPCLDAAVVATALGDTTHAFIAGTNYSFGANGTYPATYGVDCGAHDSKEQQK